MSVDQNDIKENAMSRECWCGKVTAYQCARCDTPVCRHCWTPPLCEDCDEYRAQLVANGATSEELDRARFHDYPEAEAEAEAPTVEPCAVKDHLGFRGVTVRILTRLDLKGFYVLPAYLPCERD